MNDQKQLKNAVIYARYSSAGQKETSIEDQINDCRRFAKNNNYNIVGTYADYAKSGRTDHRSEFQRMIKDSASNGFEVVIVWKLDRFGRNREDMALNKVKLKKNGVKVVSAIEHIPDSPEGVILESLMEGLAEYYSLNLAQNVKRGMRSNAEKARPNGIPPYGYKSENGKFVIDEDKATVVRMIYNSYTSGIGIPDIVKTLNSKGIRTARGKKFCYNTVHKILKNERYTGTYKYSDIVVPQGMPAIINQDTFNTVQLIMRNKGFTKDNSAEEGNHYILKDKLYCGKCGEKYVSESGKGRGGKLFRYYKCASKKRKHVDPVEKCDSINYPKKLLEDAVIKTILEDVLTENNIEKLVGEIIESFQNIQQDSILPILERQKEEKLKKTANLIEAAESGTFNDLLMKRLNELEKEIKDLESQIAFEKIKNPLPTPEAVYWTLSRFKSEYIETEADKIKLVTCLIDKVILNDNTVVIYLNCTGNPSFDIPSSTKSKLVHQSSLLLNQLVFDSFYSVYYAFDLSEYLQSA